MKIIPLSALFFSGLFLAGCASSSSHACKSASSATLTVRQVYNPATDTTTVTDGDFTWFVKGNLTNTLFLPEKPSKHVSSEPAINLVQSGSTILWKDGTILHVAKRDGNSIEDIRIGKKTSDGHWSTITAKTGTLQPGSVENPADKNSVTLLLREAQGNNATTRITGNELKIVLAK